MRHTSLFLLALSTTSTMLGLAACGGDDPPAATTTGDAGTTSAPPAPTTAPTDAGAPDAPAPSGPQAAAISGSVYLGQQARLDGTPSTGPAALTFAWKLTSVPAGSAVTTASLSDAAAAQPTFAPDKAGAYVFELTVTSNGLTSTTSSTTTAVDPPVFVYKTENDASAGYEARIEVIGAAEGTASKPVTCFRTDAGSYDSFARSTAMNGTDWWEAPAAEASPLAFVFEHKLADGGASTVLGLTTSTSTCATAAKALDALPGAAAGMVHPFEQPHLSPDGKRVAYVRFTGAEGARVATVGVDGAGLRILGARFAQGDGGPSDAGINGSPQARPFWVDADTVAWVQGIDGGWQVVRADDAANAGPQVLATCTGTGPTEIDILPNGDLVVARTTANGTEIVAFPVDPGTKACGAPRNLSQLPTTGNVGASDFALSPDKTRVAFLANDAAAGKTELRVVNVDGATPPVAVAEPVQGWVRGPRWVGGGAFLTWGANASSFDAGSGTAVAVVAADGGVARAATVAPAGGTVQTIGNGVFSCGIGQAAGSGATFAGVASVLAMRLLRRRRRAG